MSNHYTYRAEWSAEDDEFVGLVAEFPSLSWLAPTAGEAIAGAEKLVDDILADMVETGETPPEPLSERRYSGKLSVRTSPEQHRRLTIEAAEQGVSVNTWIIQKLSAARVPAYRPPALSGGLAGLARDAGMGRSVFASRAADALAEHLAGAWVVPVRAQGEQFTRHLAESMKDNGLILVGEHLPDVFDAFVRRDEAISFEEHHAETSVNDNGR